MFVIENKTFHKTVYVTCKIIRAIATVALILFAVWFGWSIIEVWMHNATMLDTNPYQYSDFNMFQMMMP